jgi:PIN like domain
LRFFLDNHLPTKLAKSLHILVEPEHQIVHLKDRLIQSLPLFHPRPSGYVIYVAVPQLAPFAAS